MTRLNICGQSECLDGVAFGTMENSTEETPEDWFLRSIVAHACRNNTLVTTATKVIIPYLYA